MLRRSGARISRKHQRIWAGRFGLKDQSGVGWCSRPFFKVASPASGHNVAPICSAAQRAGDDMIDGKVAPFISTILAGVSIPFQNISFGKRNPFHVGSSHVPVQSYYSGKSVSCCRRAKIESVLFDGFCFAQQDKNKGASCVCELQRLVRAV